MGLRRLSPVCTGLKPDADCNPFCVSSARLAGYQPFCQRGRCAGRALLLCGQLVPCSAPLMRALAYSNLCLVRGFRARPAPPRLARLYSCSFAHAQLVASLGVYLRPGENPTLALAFVGQLRTGLALSEIIVRASAGPFALVKTVYFLAFCTWSKRFDPAFLRLSSLLAVGRLLFKARA